MQRSPTSLAAGMVFHESNIPCSSYTIYSHGAYPEPIRDMWHIGPFHWDENSDQPEPDGLGWMLIRIKEIVKTEHCGTLAVYYRVYLDPEGDEISHRRKVTSVGALRGLIAGHRMQPDLPPTPSEGDDG